MAFTLGKKRVFQTVLQALWLPAFLSSMPPLLAERCGHAVESMGTDAAVARAAATRTIAVRYFYDAILHRSWAVERDCDHPESPEWLVPVDGIADEANPQAKSLHESSSMAGTGARVWVRGGSHVLVWRTSGNVQIQLTGIALESAPLGAELAVRIGAEGGVVHGIVRGPGSVELLPGSPQWSQP